MFVEFAHQHADLLLLSILRHKSSNGSELVAMLVERANGDFALSAGVVYPALYKLEASGLVASQNASSSNARLYTITDAGRLAFVARLLTWKTQNERLQAFLDQ